MAITDGIVIRAQPLPAASTLIDVISGNPYTGTATTLATTISGEDAVRVHSGDLSGTLQTPFTINTPTGEGATQLVRYKLNSLPVGDFDKLFLINDTVGATSRALNITNAGGDLRARVNDTQSSVTITGSGALGVTFTIVQVRENLAGTDENRVWIKQTPADPNRAPDFLDVGDNHAARTVGVIELLMGTGCDVEILDHIVWNRPITQAEASDVADDVRAQLPISGGGTTSVTTGTAVPTQTEADIVAGGKTIILTLTDDTWVAAGTGPIGSTADTQAIIDGLDSAQVEATGWNAEVRDKEVTTAVVRTSSTVCTITLTASALYDITATETITATIPAAALVTSLIDVVSTPTFTVTHIVAVPSITTEPLKNNTGQLLFSESGVIADVYDTTDGTLVVRKTGLTSDISGIVTFTDALMSAATIYRVVITLTGNEEGIARITSV